MPFTGLSLFAPLHLLQVGLGPRSDCRISTTLPCSVPSAAWGISTPDFSLPVSSSMVVQRPVGDCRATANSGSSASDSRDDRSTRMISPGVVMLPLVTTLVVGVDAGYII